MIWNMRHVKLITRVILACNALVCMWMTFVYLPKSSSKMSTKFNFIGSPEYGEPMPLHNPNDKTTKNCERDIVLFGMREHWLVFCKYPEFSRFKNLIVFPRTIDCPKLNCSVFLNYTKEPQEIRGYDIVVFTNVYEWITPEMWDWAHGNRSERQKWVMITEESPLYAPGVQPPRKYGNTTFDWFDSYKSDSDFIHRYGYFQPFVNVKPPQVDLYKLLKPKHKMIAWLGSHCETLQWNRQRFVDDLGKSLKVDKYGKCGTVEIPWNNDRAIFKILGVYKFYLSLENSCCDDYITEKFWRALEMGLVPIVVGAPLAHYVKYAPPNSFIHADQFDSMTDLVLYLLGLDADDEKYLEYFKWRKEGRLVNYGQEEQYVRPLSNDTFCNILHKSLNSDPNDRTMLDYFGKSWIGSCTNCGTNSWLNSYMYPKNYTRVNREDIWA